MVKTILQDVLVLAVGDLIQSEIPRQLSLDPVTQEPKIEDLREKKNFTTVTLELEPEQAQRLVWLTTSGNASIYLTLRNTNDRRIIDIASTTEQDVGKGEGRVLSGDSDGGDAGGGGASSADGGGE